jgi:hypothetical protein
MIQQYVIYALPKDIGGDGNELEICIIRKDAVPLLAATTTIESSGSGMQWKIWIICLNMHFHTMILSFANIIKSFNNRAFPVKKQIFKILWYIFSDFVIFVTGGVFYQ